MFRGRSNSVARQGTGRPTTDEDCVHDDRSARPVAKGRAAWLRPAIGLSAVIAVAGLAGYGLVQPDGHAHLADAVDPAGPLPAQADAVAERVLGQIYAAFGEREEGAIYDALARVAEGAVLDELYLEKRAALVGDATGATGQTVHGLDLLEAVGRPDGEVYRLDARWQVIGAVSHGDHTHIRGNIYAARLELGARVGGWRLTGFELREMRRADEAAPDREPDG